MTIQPYEPHAAVPALLDRTTDSWTAVLRDVVELAGNIAHTEFVPKDMRGSVTKVTAAVLYSRELGLPPMTGLAGVHVINGRPGIYAEMMRALILQSGHEIRVMETNVGRCRMRGRRKGVDDWTEVTYTMEEAKMSGDFQRNPNYRSRPADMLVARCTTRLARLEFADVIHGLHSVEELQDLAGDAVEATLEVLPVETATVQRAPRTKAKPIESAAPVIEEASEVATAQAVEVPAQAAVEAPPAPPARKRPDLPRRGGVRTPQAEAPAEPPQEAQSVLGDEPSAEVHQGEVKPLADRTRGAIGVLVKHFARLGVNGRDDRLRWTALLVGHDVATTNDLQLAEVLDAIRRVEQLRDYDQLLELAQAIEDAERGAVGEE